MAAPTVDEILALEREFWNTFKTNDAATMARLTDQDCVLVGAQGVSLIHPADFAPMMQHAQYVLTRFELDRESVQLATVGDDVAIIGYRATEQVTLEGKELTLEVNDSSVWRRREGQWVCASHTESIAGDPFGRDRRPA